MNEFYLSEKLYLVAIDPIHVGTGGYRLGSVDNTIIRDPSNKIPKLPGSGISGVVKSFYPYTNENQVEAKKEWECLISEGGCGKSSCAICNTFGFSKQTKDEKGKQGSNENRKGRVQFFDANIMLFPVFTSLGTKWITTLNILKENTKETELINLIQPPKKDTVFVNSSSNTNIAIGWVSFKQLQNNELFSKIQNISYLKQFAKDILVINEDVFSFLVNNNLEVRTSTRIDHKTGSVIDGALFTYEAIPRSTVFSLEINIFNYDYFNNQNVQIQYIKDRLDKALQMLEIVGLGGMNTRGFGRMKLLNFLGVSK